MCRWFDGGTLPPLFPQRLTLMSFDFASLSPSIDNGFIIGKANVMYTLYQYECREITDSYTNKKSYIFSAHWVKNLSKDINVVKKAYPNCKINEDLHGRLYSAEYDEGNGTAHEVKYCPPTYVYSAVVFPFGKYKGTKICECTDEGYLCWMLNPRIETLINGDYVERHILDTSRNEFELLACIDRLTELGGKKILGRYVPSTEVNSERVTKALALIENARANKPLTFEINKKLNGIGVFDNLFGLDISVWFSIGEVNCACKTVASRFANYGMLMFSDGKYHKPLGKTITINNYKFYDGDAVVIDVKSCHDYNIA